MPRESSGAGWAYPESTYQPEATDLTGTGALDLTTFTGRRGEIAEFGFRVSTALVGGSQSYDLVDANNVLIATVALTAAAGGKAQTIKTGVIAPTAPASVQYIDSTVIKLRRRAGGTTVSAGTGTFYVRWRERLQQRT